MLCMGHAVSGSRWVSGIMLIHVCSGSVELPSLILYFALKSAQRCLTT